MKQQLIVSAVTIIVALFAATIVMVFHEITKSVAYWCYIKIYNKKYNKLVICPGILKLHRYIDPIGMILALTNYVIFSKQYPFIIKSKKASLLIGLTGYISIVFLFIGAIISHNNFLNYVELHPYLEFFLHGLFEFIAYFCVMLLLANLFPITSFDITLIVAAISPFMYVKIRKFDMFYKLTFLVLSLLGIFTTAGVFITTQFLIE